jgi:UDP-N-acetylglucosamine diphosphorylase / glucose-1-phosphate thymidylyltransferase / UDP-N-acetylgalactosamine diphosphorylase / glucosamine-1-phosphate N-acetyltransferase / galactosamine-1-phosphate N-acetyltransferase
MAKLTTTAIILAAGSGKRFFPFITPKPLFPFMGKTLLQTNLTQLSDLGFKEVIIVTSPAANAQIEAIPSSSSLKRKIVLQTDPNGMAGALIAASNLLNNHQPILVRNGTDILDTDSLSELKSYLGSSKPAIVGHFQEDYFPGGYIALDTRQEFSRIIEKPLPKQRPSNLVKLVYDYIPDSQTFFSILTSTQSKTDDLYEKALTTYLKKSTPAIITYKGSWQSIKYPHHLLSMIKILLDEIPASVPDSQNSHLSGPILMGQNVTIYPGAIIKGPVYLGDNVVVGNHALIRDSMIEANSVIGSYSEVVRSYVGENCNLHRVYLGDSVLEKNVNMGAGSTTANWRFDQKPIQLDINQQKIDTNLIKCGAFIGQGTKIGINVSLMPGTLIGHNSTIMPASLAKGTIPPHTTVGSI